MDAKAAQRVLSAIGHTAIFGSIGARSVLLNRQDAAVFIAWLAVSLKSMSWGVYRSI